jgi:Mg2+-importing ATPase
LAVGLTPQLLPAIISINLAHGAKKMAGVKVIVKRLAAIENFGSMNVLCSDKTGTLTEGEVHVKAATGIEGRDNEKVARYAYLNAVYESGFVNPIDTAIRADYHFDLKDYRKLDEVPYDFIRKRLSILVANDNQYFIVTKGALREVLAVCATAEIASGDIVDLAQVQPKIEQQYEELSSQGFRTLGIAYRNMADGSMINKDSETAMTFLGFLILFDPPKAGIKENIQHLKNLGIKLTIITGDNKLVAASLSRQIGIENPRILTGQDLHHMSDEALIKHVNEVDVFAEVDPNHKERIILALRKAGNVVGYMGDGINDGSALHAADIGISVESAVDVAKEAADIVLLEKNLDVLSQGVCEGRHTFANTIKYVFMATSANFGNMFSMAGASLLLSFLPLLPKQILLTNLLTDFPEMTIATDNVDQAMIEKPRRWDIKFIRNFMITFGLVSSIFDYLTFGILLFILKATPAQFRTGWFIESVISATLIVLVVRTQKPFFKSKPGKYLVITTLLVIGVTLVFPFTPFGRLLGFTRISLKFFLLMGLVVMLYFIMAEWIKALFYRKIHFGFNLNSASNFKNSLK